MSNPDNAATHEDSGNDQQTHEQQVNTVVAAMTKQDDGTWMLPEGDHSEEVKFAATVIKRQRDTQSRFTSISQENVGLKTELDAFKEKLASTSSAPSLTAEQQEELETLKHTDPDAWRVKLNTYDEEAKANLTKNFQEVSVEARNKAEVIRREAVLEAFTKDNPKFTLSDDDVPPRISKKLESGEISFEDFLVEVRDYSAVILSAAQGNKQPNLNNTAGHGKPEKKAVLKDAVETYKTAIF